MMKILVTLALFLTSFAYADWIHCPQVKSEHTFRVDKYTDDELLDKGWNHDKDSNNFFLHVEKAEILEGQMICSYSPAPGFKVLHSYTKPVPTGQKCRLHDNKRSFICFNMPN